MAQTGTGVVTATTLGASPQQQSPNGVSASPDTGAAAAVPNKTPFNSEADAMEAGRSYTQATVGDRKLSEGEYAYAGYQKSEDKAWYFTEPKFMGTIKGGLTPSDLIPAGIDRVTGSERLSHNHPSFGIDWPSKRDVFSSSRNGPLAAPGYYVWQLGGGMFRYQATRPLTEMDVHGHDHDRAPDSWVSVERVQ
jgi:hypothetical protein